MLESRSQEKINSADPHVHYFFTGVDPNLLLQNVRTIIFVASADIPAVAPSKINNCRERPSVRRVSRSSQDFMS